MLRPLDRRAMLKGLAGSAVGLPFLDAMIGRRASAQTARPMRYFVGFVGSSIGIQQNFYAPKTPGRGYDLSIALKPLGGRTVDATKYPWDSLAGEFSVVSNLRIPWDPGAPGGRPAVFHSSSPGPLLSGVRATNSIPDARGPTSDEIVAAQVKDRMRFRSLHYRAQLERYRTSYAGNKGYMSYRRGVTGAIEPNTPIVSPRLAYEQLFTGFRPADTSAADAAAQKRALDMGRSVLDLVRENAGRLMMRVSAGDRLRLQRHFDEIRDLEGRLTDVSAAPASPQCRQLPDPGPDPSSLKGLVNTYPSGAPVGYAGEDQRARLLCDLVHMAFTCDMTRVATLMLTFPMCFMTVEFLTGRKVDLHDLGHGGGTDQDIAAAIGWHVRNVAYLADKLRRTPEGDGNLLDRSVLVLVNEGGIGFDPEQGTAASTHSTDNMVVLVGGGRAAGLKPGQHIVGAKRHPAQVLISAMNAAGAVTDALGEIRGGIAELASG